MNLVNIRNAEMEYFSTFYFYFGTRSALVIAFVCSSISQVPGLSNPSECPYIWRLFFWYGSAGTLACAVHVMLCSLFVGVFGEGMGIRGPLGSMVRAVDGMIEEQMHILFYFNLTIFFFGFFFIGMAWIMMDTETAWVSTALLVCFMFLWYHYNLRIYNKFSFTKFQYDYLAPDDNEPEIREEGVGDYLTIKTKRKIHPQKWKRYYVVIRKTLIYYYKDKYAYDLDETMSINRRPINLEGYTLVVGSSSPPFSISLVPSDPNDVRKVWQFRCDTIAEFNEWVNRFLEALKLCRGFTLEKDYVKVEDGMSERLSSISESDYEYTY